MNIFDDKINSYRDILDSHLIDIYKTGPESLRKPINHTLSGKGKRFRPILTLIIADINNVPIEDAIYPALSIELLHNFTLVHDDIMDKDVLRHGIETVHEKWDENTAILSGDAMLAISLKLLMRNKSMNKLDLIQKFVNGLLSVCEGQAFDIEFESRKNVSVNEYKQMIYLKTAYMIGLSAQIGGIVCNLPYNKTEDLKEFGECIGMVYQVQDDLLELFSDSKSMNKSLDSDFALHKKTFLWVSTPQELKPELNMILDKFEFDKTGTIKSLRNFMVSNNIKLKAENFIEENIQKSKMILNNMEGNIQFLRYYSDLIFNREY
tara:strand:- start:3697 stop:4659 length:963 start_codon:yes stop_codon:yes gene_type:complete